VKTPLEWWNPEHRIAIVREYGLAVQAYEETRAVYLASRDRWYSIWTHSQQLDVGRNELLSKAHEALDNAEVDYSRAKRRLTDAEWLFQQAHQV